MPRRQNPTFRIVLLLAAVTAVVALAACGNGNSNENGAGNGVDVAFIKGMTEHHQSAIDMAQVAKEQGESTFVKDLADDIVDTQQGEVRVMEAIHHDLESLKAEDLGLGQHAMGMDGDMAMLEDAKPFDREFIDMMIAHHQGAIRMAHVEHARGKSKALKNLAQDMIDAQSQEIKAMNAFRKRTYGAVSPAGGVPSADELPPSSGGGHSGH